MATNVESAMKHAEEEDLWIGDSGALIHKMRSEEHVFNKKLISGSMRAANGAHIKMMCEGDINVDVITKNGNITSGTLRVKVIPGIKQRLSASHKQCWVVGPCKVSKQNKESFL